MKLLSQLFLAASLFLCAPAAGQAQTTFEAGKGTFLLDGKPFVVKAAELHYPRIPRPYWEHRIEMVKALGMNTVCLYVFWNAHEPQPDQYDFTGQNDLAAFIRLCQKHGLKVILRPGPYVCAEWEMGGLPWWLLKKKDIRLREDDDYFLSRVQKFEREVARQVSSLTVEHGGPIIMVQVENEYGSYGVSKEYVSKVRDMVREGFPGTTLFQCDWASNFTLNGLDDLIWTMNFGTGANIDQQFQRLRQLRPDSPLMCSEFWSGWFDKWGANHETRPADDMNAGIDEMLSKGISFSLYMTHGGTNWGHWAGANSPGFAPDVTSYDYDAPINEAGQPTPKYYALRQVLAKYQDGRKLPAVPKSIATTAVKTFQLTHVAPLWDNIPATTRSSRTRSFEEMDMGFGSAVYTTRLPRLNAASTLTLRDAHDFAQVFVDGQKIGTLDRRMGERTLRLPAVPEGARLDIVVEAMGRINFGRAIKDFKGLVGGADVTVEIDGRPFTHTLTGWDTALLPDSLGFYDSLAFRPITADERASGQLPAGVYRGTFSVKKPADTFLRFDTWGKGLVYVNGHALGRIWSIGPQQTLYVPGCWLQKGQNEIIVFDIVGPKKAESEGLRTPLLDQLASPKPLTHKEPTVQLNPADFREAHTGAFAPGNGWQTVTFATPMKGRYVALAALNAHDEGTQASIAEIYLLDENGQRLSREPWTTVYADSEDVTRTNRSADKLFDLQESTSWTTVKGEPFPHTVVIDLGADHTVTAIEYLPRMEENAPHSVKDFKVFVK